MLFLGKALLLLLSITKLACVVDGAYYDGGVRTLYGYKDDPPEKKPLVIEAAQPIDDGQRSGRARRAAATESPKDASNVTVKINHLNDSHKQLMVHWVGDRSDIIICLAKDPADTLHTTPSTVYISYDYGDTYDNKTEVFRLTNDSYALIEKFFTHPKYNTHFVLNDVTNKLLYVTDDSGTTFKKIALHFVPSDVSFHQFQPSTFIVLDKVDSQRRLWLTEDYGQSWKMIQMYVKSFFWIQDKRSQQQLVVQREIPSNMTTVLYASKFDNFNVYATEVKDVFMKNDYIFTTMKNKKDSSDLYVSYGFGRKLKCVFDTKLDIKEFFVVDVTGNRALIAASHSSILSNLYVSENLAGREDKVHFSLSLPNVLAHFPNTTWKDSWLKHVAEDAFADVYKVEAVPGIYIASQIIGKLNNSNLSPQHLASRITFDHGSSWRPIAAPIKDVDGQLTSCSIKNNCSLHLSQRFSQLHPDTRSISIQTSKSAPGIIVATGVMGTSLKGHFGVYISTDAGVTWRQSLRSFYFFNMGDHGGLLTAVENLRMRGVVGHFQYSTDLGENWREVNFHDEKMRLYGLMTEPGENTTVFTMFGSLPEQHQWVIVKVDLRGVFKSICGEDDYKYWTPKQRDENNKYIPCVLGQQRTFKRRLPQANCYNGLDFDQPLSMQTCECERIDFECDFGFVKSPDSWQCIKNRSLQDDPYKVPVDCRPGEMYNRTKGYRKIPGDLCVGGLASQFQPDFISCPTMKLSNMLIYAKRERIVQIDISSKDKVNLDIPNLKNVIAIDYDLKNNCVFWADIVSDTIGRFCNDGITPAEILVSTELVSVEGMAFDWVSKNLYFVDGLKSKIELIRTDIHHSGRMRRTILDGKVLMKPRGIAVHPKAGYMFWTDWAIDKPSVSRADLDGSNVKVIADNKLVEWPNGVAVDYIAERVYWVDARLDYIGSTDLNGDGFKKVPLDNKHVAHPFAVAVFKDDLYWDDWKHESIFVTNKDHGVNVGVLVSNVTGLMDLKVIAHGLQQGSNPCVNSTCSYICVGSPREPFYKCLCPDGMEMKDGKCLCPGGAVPFNNFTCPKITGTCSQDHFACKSGACIPKLWVCDLENDCGDNSDEENCGAQTCDPNHFVCPDGKCIPQYWKCDYEVDCINGTDEANCPQLNCSVNQFKCANGRCISQRWVCDGENDCRDDSDEKNCDKSVDVTCKDDEFQCETGGTKCIYGAWKCDGEYDCRDHSDEANCGNFTCASFQFSCGPPGNECIYRSWVCDGDYDCKSNNDEKNCSQTTPPVDVHPDNNPFQPVNGSGCQEWMFTCANKKCVPLWWKCDYANDCGDGSDEEGCNYTTTQSPIQTTPSNIHVCKKNQFQCASGVCISMSWVCDKSIDCEGGEDEENCEGFTGCNEKDQFKCSIDGNCIPIANVCNGHTDCPDGSDEIFCETWNNLPGGATPSCSVGYFPCDINRCFPLASMCDGKADCHDGFDEGKQCKNMSRVYQVLQMVVDERGISDTSLLLHWWIPMPDKVKLEFMPSISSVKEGKWTNFTWTNQTEFTFSKLKAFTKYNMTVYVGLSGKNVVFPPAKYYLATTGEGVPSAPYNLTVRQENGSDVYISWSPPIEPNGIIQSYSITWFPPEQRITMRLTDNSTAHVISADFHSGIKYSFYVVAYNQQYNSSRSEIKSIVFDADTHVDTVKAVTIVNRTNGTISLAWLYEKDADGFIVVVDTRYPYPSQPNHVVATRNITIDNLPPGVRFMFKISAFKKTFKGQEVITYASTTGEPLPSVNILDAELVKNIGTSVKINWDRPKDKDNRKATWVYGVYYGLTGEDILRKSARLNTTDLSATIHNLEACEKYVISVGLVGPYGLGPITRNPKVVSTYMNNKAPPKKLSVQRDPEAPLKMLVQWSQSCPNSNTPIGYIIKIFDKMLNKTRTVALKNAAAPELSQKFDVSYGGVYEVKVSTDVKGALFSQPVLYKAPPIMPPYELKVFPESNGSRIAVWLERDLPSPVGEFQYEILVSEGPELNTSTAKSYLVSNPPFIFNENNAEMYTFAVRMKTKSGYTSVLSESVSSTKDLTLAQKISNSNLASIIIPVTLLLIALTGALAFLVMKYRRLQTSFTRFANSHYDTRSEAATFDDNILDEDDSPQIRGFSDDEPLVVA